MTKALKKEISKLTKIPHPKGRKTAQLLRKVNKLEARKKIKRAYTMRTNVEAERYLYFKEQLAEYDVCTPAILLETFNRYLSRFDEELEQISLKREVGGKRGRQHASREDVIKMTIEKEVNEFNTCGIELPAMLNPKQFQQVRAWNGELRFLQNFKLERFNKARLMNLIQRENKLANSSDDVTEDKITAVDVGPSRCTGIKREEKEEVTEIGNFEVDSTELVGGNESTMDFDK